MAAEEYFTRNYLFKTKEDSRPWGITHDEYFIRKSYHEDFQIEFEKYVNNEFYQDLLVKASEECEINSSIIYPTK